MNRTAFFEAAGELSGWVENLFHQTEASLIHVEDELCRKREAVPGELPSRGVVAFEIGAIGERIEEVMYAFDKLCQAAGRSPPFELPLRLLDAPRPVLWDVRERLDGLPAGFRGPCPPDESAQAADR